MWFTDYLLMWDQSFQIGVELGDSLVKLAKGGLNLNDVQLIGHSLGAHIMGYAGKRARENGHVVQR